MVALITTTAAAFSLSAAVKKPALKQRHAERFHILRRNRPVSGGGEIVRAFRRPSLDIEMNHRSAEPLTGKNDAAPAELTPGSVLTRSTRRSKNW